MDIERLTARNKNGLAYLVNVKPDEQEVDSPYKNTLKCILDCFERLAQYEEEDIARQSTTREEVAEAILLVEELAEIHVPEWRNEESSMKVGDDCSINECLMTLAIAALQAYQPWIPVSERLPTDGDEVICFDLKWGVMQADYTNGTWWLDNDSWTAEHVTHWMPLPQPPKGE